MRNLEFKARLADLSRAEEIARRIGASYGGDLHQVDTYYRAPHGRLKLRAQVARLSDAVEQTSGELIYYERAEAADTRWSHYFTAPTHDAPALDDVLNRALGTHQRVEKSRRLYWHKGARVHLDWVTGLGAFIEFEVPSNDDDDEQARAHMAELLSAFELQSEHAIRASYSELMEELL